MAEDEVIRYHDQLNGHEFEQTPGETEEQGNQALVHGVAKSQA